VEGAPADAKRYNNLLMGPFQGTGGSTAIANSFDQLRAAGATARAMLVAAAALLPAAIAGAFDSTFGWSSVLAVVALGVIGTGVAFVWFSTLITRIGPARAAVSIYVVPVVAVGLGALFRDERVHAAALFGTALVLAGAYMTSRPRPSQK
ncbi:MAG: hypothetical protein QOE60_2772, partial [Thermoleophilaceae bacterium]|nr:hypothetical protein [Thermoleophilaceae bacterium]